ncbi:MAG: hypothetical protein ACOCSF_04900 [Halanaeroarchaeum sp.]
MQRRKFLATVGSLTAASAVAMGTGAFTSVSAERRVSVTTESDADGANLGLEANEDYEGDAGEYAAVTDDMLELTFDDINKNAVTMFEDLITVTNNGTQECEIRVSNDFGEKGEDPIWGSGYGSDGPMDILNGTDYSTINTEGDSIVGGNDNQTAGSQPVLGSGDSATLTVVIDTRSFDDLDLDGEIQIIAD